MVSGPWQTGGNPGTTPPTDFLGTTDNHPLVVKTDGAERLRVAADGNVGIGTTEPGRWPLSIQAQAGAQELLSFMDPNGNTKWHINQNWISSGLNFAETGVADFRVFIATGGNVGIGTNVPATKLHVAGDLTVTGDVLLAGADCAEHFDLTGPLPEAGTVMVIDEDGAVRESRDAYDKKVAGVVSGAGEFRHGIVLDSRQGEEGRIPLALVGKVYCKVDAQYSPIEVGDLLTTSPTPGHAMRAVDPARAFGSVVGKALRCFGHGRGMVPILVALQ
jgi:hypothetical protein